MIKNVVFDLGNVLLKGDPSIVLEKMKLQDEIFKDIKSRFFENWNYLDLGEESLEEHFNNCKFDFDIDESIREVLLNYFKYRPFNNEMIELMNKLKQNNYKIFILSNNNKEAYNYLKQLPIFECVDGWIVSCDYNVIKPSKDIYIKLFDTFNINPEECYFIDDNIENIEMGLILGMKGFSIDVERQELYELIDDMKANSIVL